MKIIFLDIDGVLLSGRAIYLPENDALRAWLLHQTHSQDARLMAANARFDPCAVSLVNRLCEHTGARLVIHSNWRRIMKPTDLRAKLVEQGLHASHFHDDWYCGMRFSSRKHHDISEWLSDHRLTPEPHRPDYGILPLTDRSPNGMWQTEEEEAAFYKALRNYGIDAIAIDDEPMADWLHQVRPAFEEGFRLTDYRIACAFLGGTDTDLGVYALSSDDNDRLMEAFAGNRIGMFEWLCQPTRGANTRLELLHPASASASSPIETRRAIVWKQLDRHLATHP